MVSKCRRRCRRLRSSDGGELLPVFSDWRHVAGDELSLRESTGGKISAGQPGFVWLMTLSGEGL